MYITNFFNCQKIHYDDDDIYIWWYTSTFFSKSKLHSATTTFVIFNFISKNVGLWIKWRAVYPP